MAQSHTMRFSGRNRQELLSASQDPMVIKKNRSASRCSNIFLMFIPLMLLNDKVPLVSLLALVAIKNKARQTSPWALLKQAASPCRFSASPCMLGQHKPENLFQVLWCIEMLTIYVSSPVISKPGGFAVIDLCHLGFIIMNLVLHKDTFFSLSWDLIIQFSRPMCSPKPRESLYL